jgi:hypothetical protein
MMSRAHFLLVVPALLASFWASDADAQAPRQGCEVVVYWDGNYGGDFWGTKQDHANVTQYGRWNDQISSINVVKGMWEFYEHSNYQGEVMKVGPGGYNLDGPWNDRISSFRCVQPTP